MTEGNEVRASKQEVEGFVGKLKEFHRSLAEPEQAMLEAVLDGAVAGDTGGYAAKVRFAEQGGGWEELVGFLAEGDDAQGFTWKYR